MSKLMFMVALCLVCGLQLTAQQEGRQKRTPLERADMQMKWSSKNLNLSSSQGSQLKDIFYKYAVKRDSIADSRRDPSRRDAMLLLQQQRETEIKGVLSAAQFSQFQAHEQEMRNRRMDQRQHGRPYGGDDGNR